MAYGKNSAASFARVLSPDALELLQEAAELCGVSIDEFILGAAQEKARSILDRERFVEISQSDAEMLADLLQNPPGPNAALLAAFKRFRDLSLKDANRDV